MDFTKEQLEKIKAAYASGVLRVRFGDQDITYKSEEEMRKIIVRMEAEIKGPKKVQVAAIHFTKGLG